jgi:hypothetical protein
MVTTANAGSNDAPALAQAGVDGVHGGEDQPGGP